MGYDTPEYFKYKEWIRNQRLNGKDYTDIKNKPKGKSVSDFLEAQRELNDWHITTEDWCAIVDLEEEAEKKNIEDSIKPAKAMLTSNKEENEMFIPPDSKSSWQLYKKRLLEDKGFKKESVDEIESTTLRILHKLKENTVDREALKGLVIGNVQSGKTANMAALIAMAADWEWNMFIVLSGTIENLRRQTQERLFTELNNPGHLCWISFDHLQKNSPRGEKLSDLHLTDSSQRYINVCLKNSSRLKKLIQWLQSDINNQQKLRILLIDDEADQAGINTAGINVAERSKINRYICSLVNGNNENHEKAKYQYRAMNYIGYTATPYANFLNEAERESLYPKDFITTLQVSNEYFGPQQIFGLEGKDVEGLSIVRTVNTDPKKEDNDIKKLTDLHNGDTKELPQSLQDSLTWFLCSAACYRIWNIKKPVSMLVHTSQKTDHHRNVSEAIQIWLAETPVSDILKYCENIWNKETKEFNKTILRSEYKQYGRLDSEINDYPDFVEVKKEISNILACGISYIKLDDESQELTYTKGIHLCVDNCKNNKITEDGFHIRLAYPEESKDPSKNLDFASIFIVVGGATLSRGLTLQGLTTTYFLRSSNQADSLMQMGRWFGYRKNYELLQRLWITPNTQAQFEFLSTLDYELREEISNMENMGLSPRHYGPRVRNTPDCSFIRITAKNKMQSAQETDWDFSGTTNQTFLFDNDDEKLQQNIDNLYAFINSLGVPTVTPSNQKECNYRHAKSSYVWKEVEFSKIKALIEKFNFNQRLRVLNNKDAFIKWLDKQTEEQQFKAWNVIIVDKNNKKQSTSDIWDLQFGPIHKVRRSRRYRKVDELNNTINIGVLLDPEDQFSDIDLDGIGNKIVSLGNNTYELSEIITNEKINKSKAAVSEIRKAGGVGTVPLLIVYMIDKSTVVFKGDSHPEIPKVNVDLAGLSFYIPGDPFGKTFATTVSIHMPPEDEGDMNGTNDFDESER